MNYLQLSTKNENIVQIFNLVIIDEVTGNYNGNLIKIGLWK